MVPSLRRLGRVHASAPKTGCVRLDKASTGVQPFTHLRESERGILSQVSKTTWKKVSGLMLKSARLLTPPIHPRVSTGVVPSALRLITRAGRGDAIRSA